MVAIKYNVRKKVYQYMSGHQHLTGAAIAGTDLFLLSRNVKAERLSRLTFFFEKIAAYFTPKHTLGWVLCVFCFLIGNLFPDVDSPNSLLGRHIRISGGGHRRWMHTVYPILPCLIAGFMGGSVYICWFAVGAFLHLFLDAPSKCGVCFFNPVTGYREYPGGAKIKKGHWFVLYANEAMAWLLLALWAGITCLFLYLSRNILF